MLIVMVKNRVVAMDEKKGKREGRPGVRAHVKKV